MFADDMVFRFLIDASMKGTVILGLAALLTWRLRRSSAALRHWVWSMALLGVLLTPALSSVVPSWQLPLLSAESQLAPAPQVTVMALAAAERGALDDARLVVAGGDVQRLEGLALLPWPDAALPAGAAFAAPMIAPSESPAAAALARTGFEGRWPPVWLGVWLFGTLFIVGRWGVGIAWVGWLSRWAHPVQDPDWLALLSQASTQLGLSRPVRLWRGPQTLTPMTWGVLRPVILLPREAEGWSREKRRVVVLHELAHVKRRDTLTQMMGLLACALFWFNPLVWCAAHRMRVEREHACDDQVLETGTRASAYAGHLLDIARTLRSARVASLATIAMARRSQLESRLKAILNPGRNRRGLTPLKTAYLVGLMLVVIVPLAAVQPWAPLDSGAATIQNTSHPLETVAPALGGDVHEAALVWDALALDTLADPQFVVVSQEVNRLQQQLSQDGGGGLSAATLQSDIDTLIETAAKLLQLTAAQLHTLSAGFEAGNVETATKASESLIGLSQSYDHLMREVDALLAQVEHSQASDAEVQAMLDNFQLRLQLELEDEVDALEDAAERLVDAIDVYVEIQLSERLGAFGQALVAVIGVVSQQIKIEIKIHLHELFKQLKAFDRHAQPRIQVIIDAGHAKTIVIHGLPEAMVLTQDDLERIKSITIDDIEQEIESLLEGLEDTLDAIFEDLEVWAESVFEDH